MVQSVCVAKFSPLSGPGSEILADVTFVTDGGDGQTEAHTHITFYVLGLVTLAGMATLTLCSRSRNIDKV